LKLSKPWLAFDLKSGVVTFREGKMTGALPGIVVRGPQNVLMAEAAE
jgi:N-acyl-D-amino-acid deacylase